MIKSSCLILKKNEKNNELVEEYIYNQYDLLGYKKQFLILFDGFRKTRDGYKFMLKNYEIKVTSSYDSTIIVANKTVSNPILKFIENKFDGQVKLTDLYFGLVDLSKKFTYEECVYFINTFLDRNTEVEIAYLLTTTKPTLDKFKKSCLFKMMMDLEKFLKSDYLE